MNKYALIQDQKVINTILLNEGVNTGSFVNSNQTLKSVSDNKISIDWIYATSSNEFLSPLSITGVEYSGDREYLSFAPDLLECYITSSTSLEVHFNREIDTSSFTNADLTISDNITLESWNYPNNFTASFTITPTADIEEGAEVSIKLSEGHKVIDTLGFVQNQLVNHSNGEPGIIYQAYYSSSI